MPCPPDAIKAGSEERSWGPPANGSACNEGIKQVDDRTNSAIVTIRTRERTDSSILPSGRTTAVPAVFPEKALSTVEHTFPIIWSGRRLLTPTRQIGTMARRYNLLFKQLQTIRKFLSRPATHGNGQSAKNSCLATFSRAGYSVIFPSSKALSRSLVCMPLNR